MTEHRHLDDATIEIIAGAGHPSLSALQQLESCSFCSSKLNAVVKRIREAREKILEEVAESRFDAKE